MLEEEIQFQHVFFIPWEVLKRSHFDFPTNTHASFFWEGCLVFCFVFLFCLQGEELSKGALTCRANFLSLSCTPTQLPTLS